MIISIKTCKNLKKLHSIWKKLDFFSLEFKIKLELKKILSSSLNSKLKLDWTQNFELKTHIGLLSSRKSQS